LKFITRLEALPEPVVPNVTEEALPTLTLVELTPDEPEPSTVTL